MQDRTLILRTATPPGDPTSGIYQVGGQPARRFRKEVIRTGAYHKAADGVDFKVEPATLDHWATEFQRMTEAGVKVPVPAGHTDDPSKNQGWVKDLFVDGEGLFATLELVGEDAIKLAGRSDVSIFSPPEFIDGKKNAYQRPITHVALCTDPVIPGLSDWEPVAANQKALVLTRKEQAKPMSIDYGKVKAALGLETEITDENAEETILGAIAASQQKLADLEAAKPKEDEPKPVDPLMLSLASKNCKLELEQLVSGGHITPAVRDKLAAAFVGEDNKALSLSLSGGHGLGLFEQVCTALKDNDPVQLGEQTGKQVLALSTPKTNADGAFDEKVHAEMKKMAGIPA